MLNYTETVNPDPSQTFIALNVWEHFLKYFLTVK